MKRITTYLGPKVNVTVWYSADLEEYEVRVAGKPNATYYTDDKDDAMATARTLAGVGNGQN